MRDKNSLGILVICLLFALNVKADDVVSVLCYPDSITFSCEQLVQVQNDIYVLNETNLISVEHNGENINLPANVKDHFTDIITTNRGEIIRAGKNFYLFRDSLTKLMSLDKKDVRMYPYHDDVFFVSYNEGGNYYLCKATPQKETISLELKLTEDILSVNHSDECLFITTENSIIMFDSEGICHKLLSAWDSFRFSVLTSCGLLVGTDNNINLVTDIETFIPLIKVGCKKMFYCDDYLYVYTPDNALLKINFKKLAQAGFLRDKARYLMPNKVLIELK